MSDLMDRIERQIEARARASTLRLVKLGARAYLREPWKISRLYLDHHGDIEATLAACEHRLRGNIAGLRQDAWWADANHIIALRSARLMLRYRRRYPEIRP